MKSLWNSNLTEKLRSFLIIRAFEIHCSHSDSYPTIQRSLEMKFPREKDELFILRGISSLNALTVNYILNKI